MMKAADNLSLVLPDAYAEDTPVLVAYSGGADSTLLLHLLHERARRTGAPLYAVHVHHGIRGSEADRDLAFCRKVCRSLGVTLFAVRVNVPALAKKQGKSLEEAARDARYRHFARLMRQHHIPLLATAHHADDNLETLLFRLCRGTGTAGLCGIPAFAPLPGTDKDADLHLFRPLLQLTKQEILDACRKRHLAFVTDATNASDDYARNRIRNRVIPEMERLFAHPQHAAARLCRSASEDCAALDGMAHAIYADHASNHAMPVSMLQAQPAAIAKRLILLLYRDYVWKHQRKQSMPEAVHLDAVYALLRKGIPGSISLPSDAQAVLDRDTLSIRPRRQTDAAIYYELPLTEGFSEIGDAGVTVWAHFPENPATDTLCCTNVYNLYTELQVRFDTIEGRVFLRPIKEGDVILQGGMHKRIRKLYGQSGVPLSLRQKLPLLCDEHGVLAVPGICVRDGCAARPDLPALCMKIYLQKQFDT